MPRCHPLRVLANFDMDSRPLLSLVLVDLPELHDRLRLGVHRSLLTRIGTMVDIGPVTPDDAPVCVRHRLERAGSTRDMRSDGLLTLHELAAGVPRVLDVVADAAMTDEAAREERLIGRATVRRAWQSTPLSRSPGSSDAWAPVPPEASVRTR
jgi:type II secretory pathway predicted ATPase ExeA